MANFAEVREQAFSLTWDEQFILAKNIAANVRHGLEDSPDIFSRIARLELAVLEINLRLKSAGK